MLTVACVLKSGGIYDATWVARLKAGVAKHLPIKHRFVCLSDVDVPCERVPLEHGWPGWWSKVELFRLSGPMLFYDLDTAIVGDQSDIAAHARAADFTMLRDFYAPDHFGSGVMAWSGDAAAELYSIFAANPDMMMAARRARMGDQAFIEETHVHGKHKITRWQDVVGDQIVSYKVHCRNSIPPDARVVCLHGKPKFADMPAGDEVRVAWEMAA
jgi:hypothetical protein